MATTVTLEKTRWENERAYTARWALANGETGNPLEFVSYVDRSVQVTGTFGAGGTVVLEGSNDGTNYHTLTDPQGNPLSFTAAGLLAVTEVCVFVRPRVTGGDGTTALTITLCIRRTPR